MFKKQLFGLPVSVLLAKLCTSNVLLKANSLYVKTKVRRIASYRSERWIFVKVDQNISFTNMVLEADAENIMDVDNLK
jgi:hypothetical protein